MRNAQLNDQPKSRVSDGACIDTKSSEWLVIIVGSSFSPPCEVCGIRSSSGVAWLTFCPREFEVGGQRDAVSNALLMRLTALLETTFAHFSHTFM